MAAAEPNSGGSASAVATKEQPPVKAPAKDEDLSEEDLTLKEQLELYVERVQDTDPGLQKVALESMRQEIRSATSSMTSVPKPLKFLHPHYGTLQAHYEKMSDSDLKKLLADILSVLALTMSPEGKCESLKYRLLGSDGDIGSWGHEYVRGSAWANGPAATAVLQPHPLVQPMVQQPQSQLVQPRPMVQLPQAQLVQPHLGLVQNQALQHPLGLIVQQLLSLVQQLHGLGSVHQPHGQAGLVPPLGPEPLPPLGPIVQQLFSLVQQLLGFGPPHQPHGQAGVVPPLGPEPLGPAHQPHGQAGLVPPLGPEPLVPVGPAHQPHGQAGLVPPLGPEPLLPLGPETLGPAALVQQQPPGHA